MPHTTTTPERFLADTLLAAGFQSHPTGSGRRARAQVAADVGGQGPAVEVDLIPGALRFAAPNLPAPVELSARPLLLNDITRDWLVGRAYRVGPAIACATELYLGSALPVPERVAWTLAHLRQAAIVVQQGQGLVPQAQGPDRVTLEQVGSALRATGAVPTRSPHGPAWLLVVPHGGIEVAIKLELVLHALLSVRAFPRQPRAPWSDSGSPLSALDSLNDGLPFGSVFLEASAGRLTHRSVVHLDSCALDPDLLIFLLRMAMDVAPHLVNRS